MAYDLPVRVSYSLGSQNFTSAFATALKPPKGAKGGRVVDIHLQPSVTFTQVTTPGYVRVGTSGDADKYAQLNCGAAAATDAYNMSDGGTWGETIDLVRDSITQVEVVTVAPTGGTPAGTGIVTVVVDWF
jgi:hypothetical protein